MSTSKRGKRFSPEVKSMVVKEYLNGTSASVLKDKYDVSEPSIYNWVKKFKEENKLATEQKTNATKTEVKKEVTQKKETPKKETVKKVNTGDNTNVMAYVVAAIAAIGVIALTIKSKKK